MDIKSQTVWGHRPDTHIWGEAGVSSGVFIGGKKSECGGVPP